MAQWHNGQSKPAARCKLELHCPRAIVLLSLQWLQEGRAVVLGGSLQWAAFKGRKFGILASALRRFSVSLYLFLIYTVHWGWVLPVEGGKTLARHCIFSRVLCFFHFCKCLFRNAHYQQQQRRRLEFLRCYGDYIPDVVVPSRENIDMIRAEVSRSVLSAFLVSRMK